MYKYKKISINGRKIDEHRYVMEQHIGRYLQRNEVVRHINGDVRDNRIENLILMSRKLQPYSQMAEGKHKTFTRETSKKGRDAILKKFGKKVMLIDSNGNDLIIIESARMAAKCIGCSSGNLSDVLNGKKKQTHGFTARYVVH